MPHFFTRAVTRVVFAAFCPAAFFCQTAFAQTYGGPTRYPDHYNHAYGATGGGYATQKYQTPGYGGFYMPKPKAGAPELGAEGEEAKGE